MKDKTILITGITGFVGQNLKNYLVDDFIIKGISRQPSEINYSYNDFFESDLKCDALVHLAGKAHDLKKVANEEEYFQVNYELTKQLFDAFLKSNAQIFIYVSSVKAVADNVKTVLTEQTIANPKTIYGRSKRMAEEYILANLPTDKKVYILRPCMIHGPGNKGNLNLLYQLVIKGIPWPLGSFKNKRSFLSIENFCFVVKELLNRSDISSSIYNIADDVSLSTNEVIAILSDAVGNHKLIWNLPPKIIFILAKLGDYLKLPLNSESLQKLVENYEVDNEKIVRTIQKSLPVSSDVGLKNTFESFRKIDERG